MGLLLLPWLYTAVGFVVSSTALYALAASAVRGRRPRPAQLLADLAAGVLLAVALDVAFTRGLDVALPRFPLAPFSR